MPSIYLWHSNATFTAASSGSIDVKLLLFADHFRRWDPGRRLNRTGGEETEQPGCQSSFSCCLIEVMKIWYSLMTGESNQWGAAPACKGCRKTRRERWFKIRFNILFYTKTLKWQTVDVIRRNEMHNTTERPEVWNLLIDGTHVIIFRYINDSWKQHAAESWLIISRWQGWMRLVSLHWWQTLPHWGVGSEFHREKIN